MNFEKYSKQEFELLGLNTPAARILTDELEKDVSKELHTAILEVFRKGIDGLNAQGHNLEIYGETKIGDISYRDESQDGQCNLRLACDVVISAGYADTID